ncbi:hypothetical protein K8O68_20620 [Salipaludibacillus sp. CUR1]|uniref:hypothetical protein n=1 Tax=Salipaludibacillus sp. CUR1 TaxID=2820003 RepID=UPI001E3DFE6A|nr:hypothetical protein [Salipaludibacillus sp. CUR1]MCE7794794.1 hypothetical protein [Salipaludibacillus sp. CUR1]
MQHTNHPMGYEDQAHSDHHQQHMQEMCQQYHLYFIQLQMMDGSIAEGIIEDADHEGVTLLMPEEDGHMDGSRQFGAGAFGGAPYGFGPGLGYGVPRRFRRFRRRRFPFFGIRTLFFPFFF